MCDARMLVCRRCRVERYSVAFVSLWEVQTFEIKPAHFLSTYSMCFSLDWSQKRLIQWKFWSWIEVSIGDIWGWLWEWDQSSEVTGLVIVHWARGFEIRIQWDSGYYSDDYDWTCQRRVTGGLVRLLSVRKLWKWVVTCTRKRPVEGVSVKCYRALAS